MINVFSYSTANVTLMQMSNLSIFASRTKCLCSACLHTQYIRCSRLMLGSLDPFNTTMGLGLTSTFATMAGTLASHLSTFFQFGLKHVGKPTAWLILSLPFALLALYCTP